MDKSRTWQDILSEAVTEPRELERVAYAARVSPVVLIRWITLGICPHPYHINKLLIALPEHAPKLKEKFLEAYPISLTNPDAVI